jgi:tetratricopeptide (TPR) repeat protein
LLDELEPVVYESDPEYAGTLCLSFAITANHVGDLEQVKEKLEQSLFYYRKTDSEVLIGKGIHNIAYHEFLIGNFFAAKDHFKEAIAILEHHGEARLISVKDYIKVLIKLNERQTAISLALQSLEESRSLNLPQLEAKFLILLAVLKNDCYYAEEVLNAQHVGDELIGIALKFLMDYCSRVDDSVGLMKYYKMAGELLNKSAIFDWEGFVK